jgi:hypothetical protein
MVPGIVGHTSPLVDDTSRRRLRKMTQIMS